MRRFNLELSIHRASAASQVKKPPAPPGHNLRSESSLALMTGEVERVDLYA